MKRVLNGILHISELALLTGAAVGFGSVPLAIPLIAVATIPASKFLDDLEGNQVKNSIFSASDKGKINQRVLSKPRKFISLLKVKDKNRLITDEALNMFLQINKNNKNGEAIRYSTKSQSLVLFLLRRLQREGYIENLEYKNAGKSKLLLEKLLIGNVADIKKKTQMYDISFELTDKPRNREELINLLNSKTGAKPVTETIDSKKEELESMKQVLDDMHVSKKL